MPRFAIHASWIMIFDSVLRLTSAMFVRVYGFQYTCASALVPIGTAAISGFAWLTLRTYDEPPIVELTAQEAMVENRRMGELHAIRCAVLEAIRAFRRGDS
jgi:hypothetical protein